MNNNYIIRKAVGADNDFIADAIIAAEKSGTEKAAIATIFNLPESEIKKNLAACLQEETTGSELSLDSYLLAEKKGEAVAAVAGWIEGYENGISSRAIRTNLIQYFFPKESISAAYANSSVIQGLLIEREKLSLQIEYVYTKTEHRGQGLATGLIKQHIQNAIFHYPLLKKVQVQVFSNNTGAVTVYEQLGFTISKRLTSHHHETLSYLPYNEKLLMEKVIK